MADAFRGIVGGSAMICAAAWSACVAEPPRQGDSQVTDVGGVSWTPQEVEFQVRDHAGRTWEPTNAPRRPVLEWGLNIQNPAQEPEPAMLLVGEADASLLQDAERSPLLEANQARQIPARVFRENGKVRIEPTTALTLDTKYTALIAGWARTDSGKEIEIPLTQTIHIASEKAGSVFTHSWPANGTQGVPTHIPFVALRFDDEIANGDISINFQEIDGTLAAAQIEVIACEEVGWEKGSCFFLEPDEPLKGLTEYKITTTPNLRDYTGATIEPVEVTFTTQEADALWTPPSWLSLECALDEVTVPMGCLLATDTEVAIRFLASGPLRVWLRSHFGTTSAVTSYESSTLRLTSLTPSSFVVSEFAWTDLLGEEPSKQVVYAHTAGPLATLSITEVCANPMGPEPDQEYVEILNWGSAPVSLRGIAVSDAPEEKGDTVDYDVTLAPGARGLLVSDRFDPNNELDRQPPPGAVIVRLDRSIGSSGLSNTGEPLYLRDVDNHRLSAAPAVAATRPGLCLVRVSQNPRAGEREAFATEFVECTPGTKGPKEGR